MKRIWKILEKDNWLMIIHSYVKLWSEYGNSSGKELEESGKILGKTCGLGPIQKIHRWDDFKKDCAGWIKWLEWDNNLKIAWTDLEWKHESPEISSTLRNTWKKRGEWLRDTPTREKHLKQGNECDQHWRLELDPPEKKQKWRMMNLKLLSIFMGNHRIRTLTEKNGESCHQ